MSPLVALVLATSPTRADAPPPEHDLHLATGVTWLSRTDRQFSPLRQDGFAPGVGLGWTWRGTRWMHTADADLAIGGTRAQPDYTFSWDGETRTSSASTNTIADLRYAAGPSVGHGPVVVHVGATSDNHFEDLVFVAAFTGSSHYLGALELGPWADARIDLGARHHLGAEASFPVATWIGRNGYAVHDDTYIWNTRDTNVPLIIARDLADGSLATLNRYQAVHTRATWRFDLHPHWTLQADLRFDWLHDTRPWPLIETRLGACASIHGRF